MKCSHCNGEIEGQRPHCPHCGRELGGLFKKRAPARRIPPKGPVSASRRIRLDKTIENAAPSPATAWLGRIVTFAILGAIIGGALPGQRWIFGAMLGLFIALQTRKKS